MAAINYYFLTFVLTYVLRVDACSMSVYAACNYGGYAAKWDLNGNGRYIHGINFQNDVISSWKARSNSDEFCAFYLCNGYETQPQYSCYYESATDGESPALPCAVSIGMNDVISTVIIREESPVCQVELFSEDLYGGRFHGPLGIGRYTLAQLIAHGVRNDEISSIKVIAAPGVDCQIELYEADNFANTHGRAIVPITRDNTIKTHKFSLPSLQEYGFLNNALSSLVVTMKETIKKITWKIDEMQMLQAVPFAMGSVSYDYQQSGSEGLWQKMLTQTQLSSWQVSYEHSVGAQVSWKTEFGSPFIGTSATLSVSISYSFTITKSNAGEKSTEYSERIEKTILPGQVGKCDWTMRKVTLDIPFTAIINKIDDFGVYTEEAIGGVWRGVGYHDSKIVCVDTVLPDICQNN